MPSTTLGQIVHRLATAAGRLAFEEASDAGLLRRFEIERDEAAFAEVVRRHGPKVFDVCRCVLGNHADAEDAFQATFLVLAGNVGSIRDSSSLAAWLHGVAYRTARKAQTRAARRREHEARVPAREPGREDDLSWAEVRLAVHEALAGLGERYRGPLVLCYLDGLTQDRAAAVLGLSRAAMKKRLERGREMLRAALARRGIGPTAVLAVAAGTPAVPSALASSAVQAALRFAADPAAVSATVLILMGGSQSMYNLKLAGALCLCVLATAPLFFAQPARPTLPPPAVAVLPEPPADREAGELAGEWRVVRVEASGKPLFKDDELANARFVFKGGKARVEGLRVLFVRNFSFTVGPGKRQKQIDVKFLEGPRQDETFLGVYVVNKDELRICLRLTHLNLPRPVGFSTVSGTLHTFILKRGVPPVKAAATPDP